MAGIQHIHGGNIREAADKYGLNIDQIIDFSANINPLGPSPRALQAIEDNLGQIIHYPDPECFSLKQELAKKLQLDDENLIIGNGAVELIYLLAGLLKPQRVLIPAPTFSEYEIAVRSCGGIVTYFNLDRNHDFQLDVEQFSAEMAGMDMAFLCNPNNPTGQLLPKEDVFRIIEASRKHNTFLVIDESFIDFLPDGDEYSVSDKIKAYDNIFILYSLTKFFAIPGLRLGAGIGNRDIVTRLHESKDPWNVNSLAQVAGTVSLQDKKYIRKTVDLVTREKNFLYAALKKIKGLQPYRPAVNYIFMNISGTGYNSIQLKDILGRQGILIRDCASYHNLDDSFIRVAVKDRASNLKLIAALAFLKG